MLQHIPVLALSLCTTLLTAQPELPPAFRQKLERSGVELIWPPAGTYSAAPQPRLAPEPFDYALYLAAEDIEIRYALQPWADTDPATWSPLLLAKRAIAMVANEDSSDWFVNMTTLDAYELEQFDADGGVLYHFRPRHPADQSRSGRLLAIYRKNRGMALVYWLFGRPEHASVSIRFFALRFTDLE